ncbi:hypothetical protein HK101_006430 [Irineochytrium annulatum]|nr:hypothetical protein HK101_006430 [Irineochytrium annulatum]
MRLLLDQLRATFGKIKGIVHGAGVGSSEMITNRSQAGFTEVFSPKVHGTWVLDQLTEQDDLDFMVLYSSIASVFSAPGQADYIAANAYLDAYADYRSMLGKRTLTVQWSTWKETGMSAEHGLARFMDEKSTSKPQDMEQDLKRVIDQMESGDVTLQQALNNLINL